MIPGEEAYDILRAKSLYRHVGNITASDLDDVFRTGNIGPYTLVEDLTGQMASVSVGDVIVDSDDHATFVQSVGFEPIDWDI